jgi:NADH:ubiquinone oxidoreductase subunit 2 (subunit N)
MGFLKEDLKSAEEAGFKLYINNAVSTGFLLLGISLIYGCTGLINIADIAFFLNNILNTGFSSNFFFNIKDFLLIIGFIFFLVGIFTKMMQSPFHL